MNILPYPPREINGYAEKKYAMSKSFGANAEVLPLRLSMRRIRKVGCATNARSTAAGASPGCRSPA